MALYLIPTPLSDGPLTDVLPQGTLEVIPTLQRFIVEELRTARRFLSAAGHRGHIDSLTLRELNEHTTDSEVEALMELFEDGQDVGLLSEAGLPAVADPGARVVALCHRRGIEVRPLTGPSSLMLTLMASGANGQSFAFNGYIPAKPEERRAALKELEKRAVAHSQSQILIETPYRNDALLGDCIKTLSPQTKLTLGVNLTSPTQTVLTKTIAQWAKSGYTIGKVPCVFILSANGR